MPRYPFNHEKKYWRESRLSHNFRFQSARRHDLLGMRSIDWNPQVAQWRNILRLGEMPWLRDHKIAGEIVFPGAGYVVMAVEALKQLVEISETVKGICLQDVAFLHPIRFIQGAEQVETQLTISSPNPVSGNSVLSQFRIFVYENGSYLECASGLIGAVVDAKRRDQIICIGPWKSDDWFQKISSSCQEVGMDPYNATSASSVTYGPAFQSLRQLQLGKTGQVIAQLNTEIWKSVNSESFGPPYTIYPSTLDGLAQIVVPASSKLRYDLPTMVPVRVDSIWIDCRNESLRSGEMCVRGECRLRGHRGASADIVGTANGSNTPLVYLEGLQTTFIDDNNAVSGTKPAQPRNLCTRMIWKPDLELMDQEQILRHCIHDRPPQGHDAVEVHRDMTLAIMTFVEEATDYVDDELLPARLEPYLQSFLGWMKYQRQKLRRGELLVSLKDVQNIIANPSTRNNVLKRVEEQSLEGAFFIHIGQNLLKVLNGEIDPLELIFQHGLAERYYGDVLASEHHSHPASAYLDLLCFKNPSMKILEVGAGTGGQTLPLLETMSSDGVKKWEQYDIPISRRHFSAKRV